ncbi:MAG: cysteine desulfurase family protein [Janthinobacterium lividum]
MRRIYLDHQATTPCDPAVLAAMLPMFAEEYGNPHSDEHAMGRAAHDAVEAARAEVAALIGADPREVVFTSGATEANNIAIKGAARHARATGSTRLRIVTVATEHKCVLESVRDTAQDGFEPLVLPVEADGRLDPERLRAALQVPTLLVSIMAANNETGVLQDLPALAAVAHESGALVHSDLAQAAGKIPVDVAAWGLDLASLSAHKLYGPKGVGALWVRRRPRVRVAPLFSGGGQERGLRSGTLPAPLVAGFGVACRLAREGLDAEAARLLPLRTAMLDRLRAAIPGLGVNGSMRHRLAGNLHLTFPGVPAAALLAACPELCLSTGSACTSADVTPSAVLVAMGLDADAASRSLRVGLGRTTSAADVEDASAALIAAHRRLAQATANAGA